MVTFAQINARIRRVKAMHEAKKFQHLKKQRILMEGKAKRSKMYDSEMTKLLRAKAQVNRVRDIKAVSRARNVRAMFGTGKSIAKKGKKLFKGFGF